MTYLTYQSWGEDKPKTVRGRQTGLHHFKAKDGTVYAIGVIKGMVYNIGKDGTKSAVEVGHDPTIWNAPAVPHFQNSWTRQMKNFLKELPDPKQYVNDHIPQLCSSWNDPYTKGPLWSILLEYGLECDELCTETVEQFGAMV